MEINKNFFWHSMCKIRFYTRLLCQKILYTTRVYVLHTRSDRISSCAGHSCAFDRYLCVKSYFIHLLHNILLYESKPVWCKYSDTDAVKQQRHFSFRMVIPAVANAQNSVNKIKEKTKSTKSRTTKLLVVKIISMNLFFKVIGIKVKNDTRANLNFTIFIYSCS